MVRLPILCYHRVGSVSGEGRWLNIEPSRLESHVRYFKRRGYDFACGRDLAGKFGSRMVALTFDDAYESAIENAVPILERLGARATFFVVSGLAGRTSEWDGEAARPLAGWPMLVDAKRRGFEIGSHTHTHKRLAEISEADQTEEIVNGLRELGERGISPCSFCYPYGSWNETARAIVQHCGYSVAFALAKRLARQEDDRLVLPRIVVSHSDVLPKLLYKLHIRPLLW